MPKLEIRSGKAAGKTVELTGSTVTLGNRRNATVELKDSWVSFNHAQITCQGGRYFLHDAHSRSGTFLNDRRVDRTPVPIVPGDRILLGKTEIVVLDEVASAGALVVPSAVPAVDTEKVASLERDLRQASGDLKNLREHVIAREKELAEANVKLLAAPKLAAQKIDEVARWKKACEDLKDRARAKLDELARYARSLEARLQSSGGADASQLIEKDHEIARLKAEVTRVQDEAQERILLAAERLQLLAAEKPAGESTELLVERKRADDLEREAGILRARVEDLEAEKIRLAAELKTSRSEVTAYEQALEERNKDLERLESVVQRAAPAGASKADAGELDRLRTEVAAEKQRADEFQKTVLDLRTQVEEINEDMLEQEDELRAEISALEKKLAEAVQPKAS